MSEPGFFVCAIVVAMNDSPPKPKYQWRATTPDKPDDFCGWDDDIRFGRILKHIMAGHWVWHLNGIGLGSDNGQADDARTAALAIEAAYDRVKAILVAEGRFDQVQRVPRDG